MNSKRRLNPKNDVLFRKLLGEDDEEAKELLIDLLNAILFPTRQKKIKNITVVGQKEVTGKQIEDKTGRLDILCETDDNEQINVEIQISRYVHMDRRSLFYLGRLLVDSIKRGGTYDHLKKTITINILDFEFIPLQRHHSTFHLYEDHDRDFMLTDLLEVHFIECPKARKRPRDLTDPLQRWLLFLEQKLSEEQRKELMAMDPMIKKAEERLERLCSDPETIRLYQQREDALIERNSFIKSAMEEGMQKGMQKGIQQGTQEIARKMLDLGIELEVIKKTTGLSEEELENL